MKTTMYHIIALCALNMMVMACEKEPSETPPPPVTPQGLVNLAHLNYLYTPVTFSNGTKAGGIYIYCEAPDYHLVEAAGEGFTCVDDVARAALVYFRSSKFATDTAIQSKAINLVHFLLAMQSDNGYFYNFVFTSGLINKAGATSVNNANWWSWRALQALTEGAPVIKTIDASLGGEMDASALKLITQIKAELVNLPQTTKVVEGITVPEWLPAGSGTDQAALLIVGLIPYCQTTGDGVIKDYIKKLADGIVLMQAGDSSKYPYSAFLSWENTWHAYGNIQAYALMKAGSFLADASYTSKGIAEVDNFYPWMISNTFMNAFSVKKSAETFYQLSQSDYEQIAYGISPMVFAAIEAYKITGDDKYADIAGQLAAWFLGANDPKVNMYDNASGRCYDGIISAGGVNYNSGAESTIEALLALQNVESNPAVKTALDKYKK